MVDASPLSIIDCIFGSVTANSSAADAINISSELTLRLCERNSSKLEGSPPLFSIMARPTAAVVRGVMSTAANSLLVRRASLPASDLRLFRSPRALASISTSCSPLPWALRLTRLSDALESTSSSYRPCESVVAEKRWPARSINTLAPASSDASTEPTIVNTGSGGGATASMVPAVLFEPPPPPQATSVRSAVTMVVRVANGGLIIKSLALFNGG